MTDKKMRCIMNELMNEKMLTTREVAERLETRSNVITENAKKCLPNKKIENGKVTYWTKAEITVLLEFMKTNNNRTDLDLSNRLIGTSTELTPALKLKKALELAQEAYEEELERLRMKTHEQEIQLIEQAPKVEFFNDVAGSADTIDMKEVAKILNIKGIGRNKLFEILREKKILDGNNQPYQEYVDRGYFRIIESRFTLPTGEIKISLKTVVFQKGLDYIRKVLKNGK